jgi:hypothetical protein
MRGDVALAADGRSPAAGSAWHSPGTVQFADETASVTFVLPEEPVVALSLLLDGNDRYGLDVSAGGAFTPLATVPDLARDGLQERVVTIPPGSGRVLRLSPRSGDGMYSVAEIRPIVEAR